uniref:Rhino n=1 Tax=Drosophila paralutea TaxID=186284 RepID=Q49BJ6_9MUSC|nr:rhino [Drosophila paralutea]
MSLGGRRTHYRQVVNPIPIDDPNEKFEVEKIIGKRFVQGWPQVLVKWKGFPDENNSWEPMENVGNAMLLLCAFEAECYRLKHSALTALEHDMTPSPSTSGVSLTEQSSQESRRSKKHSRSKKENHSPTEELNRNQKGKEKVGKPAGPKHIIKTVPKTPTELPSSSHSGNGPKEIEMSPSSTKKTHKFHRPIRALNLSESSDEETPGVKQQAKPKSPKPRRILDFPQENETSMAPPRTAYAVPQHRKETETLQKASQLSDSDSSSSSSSSSSGSSSSSESSTSSSTLTEDLEGVKEITSLDRIRKEARKWEADKREAKFGGLMQNSPNIGPYKMRQPEPEMTRQQNVVISLLSSDEDPVDLELQRIHGNLTQKQNHWNFPEPIKKPPKKETKPRQASKRPISRSVPNKELSMLLADQREWISPPKLDIKTEPTESSPERPAGKSIPDWKMRERKHPFGFKRGMELDKVHHGYQVGEDFFLFVTWKGCKTCDSVLMQNLKKSHPMKVMEYLQSLKREIRK